MKPAVGVAVRFSVPHPVLVHVKVTYCAHDQDFDRRGAASHITVLNVLSGKQHCNYLQYFFSYIHHLAKTDVLLCLYLKNCPLR